MEQEVYEFNDMVFSITMRNNRLIQDFKDDDGNKLNIL